MAYANPYFSRLPGSYLFAEISRRVKKYQASHPESAIISLGIGDVTQPLAPAVITALHKAVDEMAAAKTFRGYGPEQGYAFLREAIAKHDYAARGIDISPDEIFVSDGSKSDTGLFQDLFAADAVIALAEPAYPVYADTNAMCGRAGFWDGHRWTNLVTMPCTKETGFLPSLPDRRPDVIYLCCPNNPTGTVMNRAELKRWVDYARDAEAVILFDAAYEAFITDSEVPHSIFEIEGAKNVAVEFRSFSKTAGFTGLRCAYTVVPQGLTIRSRDGKRSEEPANLHAMWLRHQCTRFNGCPYIVQRAAEAVYTPEGQQQTQAILDVYKRNAANIRSRLSALGFEVHGGINAPYIWVGTPDGMPSWDFFNSLLQQANVVCTPGSGFGPSGEGYVRMTAFGTPEKTAEALDRIAAVKNW